MKLFCQLIESYHALSRVAFKGTSTHLKESTFFEHLTEPLRDSVEDCMQESNDRRMDTPTL